MRDGALLLRVDGRREDHVGLRLERLGREGGERDHGARRGHVRLGGVGLEEEQGAAAVARGRRRHPRGRDPARPRSPPRGVRGRWSRRESRSGRTPACRRSPSASATASSAWPACAAARRRAITRSPQMTTTSPASRTICAAARTASAPPALCPFVRPGMKPCGRAGAAGEVVERAAGAGGAERGRERAEGGLGGAGREAEGGGGGAVERRRAARGHHEPRAVAPDGLPDAQVEDRRLVHELGVQHEDRVGVIDVRDPRGQIHARERAREGARGGSARRGVAHRDVLRAEPAPHQVLHQEALFVRRLAAHAGDRARAGLLQQRGGLGQRALPGGLAQEAADAGQRRGDPLVRRGTTGSRSGPCRTASRRRPPRCRARAPGRPSRRRER